VYTRNVHLVFVSKYRRPVFTDPMLACGEHLMRECALARVPSCAS